MQDQSDIWSKIAILPCVGATTFFHCYNIFGNVPLNFLSAATSTHFVYDFQMTDELATRPLIPTQQDRYDKVENSL